MEVKTGLAPDFARFDPDLSPPRRFGRAVAPPRPPRTVTVRVRLDLIAMCVGLALLALSLLAPATFAALVPWSPASPASDLWQVSVVAVGAAGWPVLLVLALAWALLRLLR